MIRAAWAPFRQGRGLSVAFGSSTTLSCNRFCRSHGAKPVSIAFLSVATNRRRVPPLLHIGARESINSPTKSNSLLLSRCLLKSALANFPFFLIFPQSCARLRRVAEGEAGGRTLKLPVRYLESRRGRNLLPRSTTFPGSRAVASSRSLPEPTPDKPSLRIDAWHATSLSKVAGRKWKQENAVRLRQGR